MRTTTLLFWNFRNRLMPFDCGLHTIHADTLRPVSVAGCWGAWLKRGDVYIAIFQVQSEFKTWTLSMSLPRFVEVVVTPVTCVLRFVDKVVCHGGRMKFSACLAFGASGVGYEQFSSRLVYLDAAFYLLDGVVSFVVATRVQW